MSETTNDINPFKNVCVECGHGMKHLFIDYGKDNIQITKCPKCMLFSDKYLEYEFVVIFLDMILQKPQVYRHLLINNWTLEYQYFTIKLGTLLILFEVYVKWAKLQLQDNHTLDQHILDFETYGNISREYLYVLGLCIVEFISWHLGLQLGIGLFVGDYKKNAMRISFAVVFSSFGKLMMVILAIWDYNDLEHSWLVNLLVLTTNAVAITVMIDDKRKAYLILFTGMILKLMIQLIECCIVLKNALMLEVKKLFIIRNDHSHQKKQKQERNQLQLDGCWYNIHIKLSHHAGSSGTGKSTFINTLTETEVLPFKDSTNIMDITAEKTVSINPYVVDLEVEAGRLTLTILDTPGFGDNMNNESAFKEILSYVEKQFDNVLTEESRIKRNTKSVDSRIHCVLYFISPNCHGLKELDCEFIKRLGARCNVIPVIAKADTLTVKEMSDLKSKILSDLNQQKLPFFNFPVYEEEDDNEVIQENAMLRSVIPFSVMGSMTEVEVGGEKRRARKYPWGTVFVDNPNHSDFSKLKDVLFFSHLEDLKDLTHDVLYEAYRTFKLSTEMINS